MNYSAASCGVSENLCHNFSGFVTPNVSIGGPVPVSPGFPP